MSYPLPKPVLVALILIPSLVGGTLAGAWEYSGSTVNNLQIVCDQPGFDSVHPSDEIRKVGVEDPSDLSVDGTWKFLYQGINGTVPWSSQDTVLFHIVAGGTTIINLRLPGLRDHINPGSTIGAEKVNVTLSTIVRTYQVGLRSFNYTNYWTNATVEVPFSQGIATYC